MKVSTIETDIVVIGSGVAGAIAAAKLAAAGRKVVILEAGPRVARANALRAYAEHSDKSPYPQSSHAPWPQDANDGRNYYLQAGPDPFRSGYLRVVGGTTWHWLGATPRLLPEDFQMQSRFGLGVDWPFPYETLEPFYLEAERELGVAGQGESGSPRSGTYPMPAIRPTYLDAKLQEALKPLGLSLEALPQARTSQTYRGRPACCGASSCIPLCPIGAKYDATVHLEEAVKKGAILVDNAVACQLDAMPDGKLAAVHYFKPDRSRGAVLAKHFFLAANAIESAKLLLISKGGRFPQGLANRSGMVGRNLMDHPSWVTWGLAKVPVFPYRGPQVTSGIEAFRAGEARRGRAAFRIDIGNDGWSFGGGAPNQLAAKLISSGLRGKALSDAMREQTVRQYSAIALAEQLPNAENRIEPAWDDKDALGIARPKITYRLDEYTKAGLKAGLELLTRVHGAFAGESHQAEAFNGAGHILGTLRMGADARQSVVDVNLRAHDHANLYCLGSSVFPTGGTANPTLTIAALALKAVKAFLAG